MDIAQLILGQIPEAIYFALFMIFAKNLKEKRIIFILVMIFEYLALTQLIQFNVWLQVIHTFMTYINLKVLYKEKAQITDVLMFTIASILLIIISFIFCLPLIINEKLVIICAISSKIILFVLLFIIKNKLNKILVVVNNRWNRNDKYKIKSLTVRNIFIVIFNAMFCLINMFMIYLLTLK